MEKVINRGLWSFVCGDQLTFYNRFLITSLGHYIPMSQMHGPMGMLWSYAGRRFRSDPVSSEEFPCGVPGGLWLLWNVPLSLR